MARKLDMKTVMEGVETEEQLAFLQSTSCDMIQGFVFSRPVAIDDFLALVDQCAPAGRNATEPRPEDRGSAEAGLRSED